MPETADLILTGGDVLTVDDAFSVARAVAVRDGRIVAVGGDAEIGALAGPGTRVVDLAGRTVLPGINDSHLHAAAWALTRPPFALDLGHPAVESIADVTEAVREAAAGTPDGQWITGIGWDVGYLAECLADPARRPHRADLDAAAPDHPVCLTDFSGHMVWVNSRALALAGVGRGTEPPAGGVIETDAAGEPTGVLKETAQSLVQALVPAATVARREEAVLGAVTALHALGITSYTDRGSAPAVPRSSAAAWTPRHCTPTSSWPARADWRRGCACCCCPRRWVARRPTGARAWRGSASRPTWTPGDWR